MKKTGHGDMRNGFFSKLWDKVEKAVNNYQYRKLLANSIWQIYGTPGTDGACMVLKRKNEEGPLKGTK